MRMYALEPVTALAIGGAFFAQVAQDLGPIESLSTSAVVVAAFWFLLTKHDKTVQENTASNREIKQTLDELKEATHLLKSAVESQACKFKGDQ